MCLGVSLHALLFRAALLRDFFKPEFIQSPERRQAKWQHAYRMSVTHVPPHPMDALVLPSLGCTANAAASRSSSSCCGHGSSSSSVTRSSAGSSANGSSQGNSSRSSSSSGHRAAQGLLHSVSSFLARSVRSASGVCAEQHERGDVRHLGEADGYEALGQEPQQKQKGSLARLLGGLRMGWLASPESNVGAPHLAHSCSDGLLEAGGELQRLRTGWMGRQQTLHHSETAPSNDMHDWGVYLQGGCSSACSAAQVAAPVLCSNRAG